MRIKLGNKNAAQRIPQVYDCLRCPFIRRSVTFCIKISCTGNDGFDDVGISEDIFKI